MSKKPKKLKELFKDLTTEKDINKRVVIINKIIDNTDKDKASLSDINIDAVIDKVKDLECSKDSDKLSLWAKLILELIRLYPNYKQRLISKVFKATSSPKFTDEHLRLCLYNSFVSHKDKTINIEDKAVIESTIIFLLFTQSMKEGSETTLDLYKKLLIKAHPSSLPYFVIEYSVTFFCYQIFKYNYERFTQTEQQLEDQQDTLKKKLILYFEILDVIQEAKLITRKSIKETFAFLLIFFSGTFSGKASFFYMKFMMTEQKVFEREIIELLGSNGVLKALKRIDEAFKTNLNHIYYIVENDKKSSEVFMSQKEYVDKEGLCQRHCDSIKRFIWNCAIEKIYVLCWKDDKVKGFDIPTEVIWGSLAEYGKEDGLISLMLDNVIAFIESFKEEVIGVEWEYVLRILSDVISECGVIRKKKMMKAHLMSSRNSNSNSNLVEVHQRKGTMERKKSTSVTSTNITSNTMMMSSTPTPTPNTTSTPMGNELDSNISIDLNEISSKISNVFHMIFNLYINNSFKGNIDDLMTILLSNPDYTTETLIIWIIRYSLQSKDRFTLKAPDLFTNFFLSTTKANSNLSREYILDSFKQHYRQVYHIPQYATVIESIIQDNHPQTIQAIISNQYSFSSYSVCLITIMNLNQNEASFRKMVKMVILPSMDKVVQEFQKKTMVNLLSKLIFSFQKDKISMVFKVIDEKMNSIMKEASSVSSLASRDKIISKNSQLALTIIEIYNSFYINKHYELHMDKESHRQGKLSCVIIHSDNESNELYPYRLIPINNFLKFCLFLNSIKEYNEVLLDKILEFYLKQLRYMFFFSKATELPQFIYQFCADQISRPEIFINFIKKNSIMARVQQLFMYINYHFSNQRQSELGKGMTPTPTPIPSNAYYNKNFNDLLKNERPNDEIKIDIISLSAKYVESMFSSITNIIKQYHINLAQMQQNATIYTNFQAGLIIPNTITNTNTSSTPNSNPLTSNPLSSLQESNKGNESMVYFEGMTFSSNFRYIRFFFRILEFYFFSFTDFSSVNTDTSASTAINFYSSNTVAAKANSTNHLIVSLFAHFLVLIKKYKQLIAYQYDIAFAILKILFMLKELLLSKNEDHIIEIIYLIVCICWPNSEKEWTLHFKKEYSFISEIPSLRTEKKEGSVPDNIKRNVLVEGFGDAVIMFFFEKISNGKKLLRIIQKVLEGSGSGSGPETSVRQRIFLDLCKWNLTSRANRDNIKSLYRRKMPANAEVYYDNLNLITIIPVDGNNTVEVIVRNPIANINMTINALPRLWKKEDNAEEQLKALLNKDKNNHKDSHKDKGQSVEETPNGNGNNDHTPNEESNNDTEPHKYGQLRLDDTDTYQNQKEYLFLSFYTQLSPHNFTNNNVTSTILPALTKQLDSSSVYISANCSVLYYPDIPSFSASKLFSYTSPVSSSYARFINSLGKTFAINEENANIFLVNDLYKNTEGLYSIYHQDTVFQIIFFCMNLIQPKNPRAIEPMRKYFFSLNFITIIWMENPYAKFDPSGSGSSSAELDQTLVYIVIYPYSSSHYFIKLKFCGRKEDGSQETIEVIKKYIQVKVTLFVGNDCKELANYLQKIIIIINTLVNYGIKKSIYDKLIVEEKDSGNSNSQRNNGNANVSKTGAGSVNQKAEEFQDNISYNNWYSRYDQLDDIIKRINKKIH